MEESAHSSLAASPFDGAQYESETVSRPRKGVRRVANVVSAQDVLIFLIAFRILNALSIKTMFQPDEFFQSLEPAWALAYGDESGAWITWEWKKRLRSSIHPAMFATVYYLSSSLADILRLSVPMRADVLIALPKVFQALMAGMGDYHTWRLAQQVYGDENSIAWTTSVAMVLFYTDIVKLPRDDFDCHRPGPLAMALAPSASRRRCPERSEFELRIVESLMMVLSLLLDRIYYKSWTFPPFRFVYFNVVQSLAVFYGRNDWHYYVSQGIPLLLTTALLFGLKGLWQGLRGRLPVRHLSAREGRFHPARFQLAFTIVLVTSLLSLISHKEVRFIYPLLPALHLFAAEGAVSMLSSPEDKVSKPRKRKLRLIRATISTILFCVNVGLSLYVTLVHQSGVIAVLDHLRYTYETEYHPPSKPILAPSSAPMTVGFLMPCHSTPWRSHLVHPGIHAWALTCEPPIDLSPSERASYLDEADRFYESPAAFLQTEMTDGKSKESFNTRQGTGVGERKLWPEHLVFFEQLESLLPDTVANSQGYQECWRGFNSHWHDDWRRTGDVIIWCRKSGT
ncbi:MAG: glycosylphosphatidylinositol anchor biosynthesis [Piccolia ochrophora]|nr:MAG: glycosylphosphatidylinositol anchor biosynthesis [Piccolia ochrophora]